MLLQALDERVHQLEQKLQDDWVLIADKKIYLDGNTKSTYLVYDSGNSRIEFYVSDTLEGFIDASNTGTRLQNV